MSADAGGQVRARNQGFLHGVVSTPNLCDANGRTAAFGTGHARNAGEMRPKARISSLVYRLTSVLNRAGNRGGRLV